MSAESDAKTKDGWHLDNTYARLPPALFARVEPSPVRRPQLVVLNRPLAASFGLDADTLEERADLFAGNALPDGAEPIAQAYAGHQFGHFTNLGDGRAILLGEQLTPLGSRFDIQLKGSGPTPYSRRGDGRAALGPMLREYIISEAMHSLGIPTTRSLAVAATGEAIMRDEPLPGAVLTRVAASHIRVGTFEYAAALGDADLLRSLTEYTLARHYPDASGAGNPALALLDAVVARQAELIARWMLIGFIHGVMNTDNMALSGETIDYGPCAFMDRYDPATVFSSIDRHGRYAYGSQPAIAQWNLARLAESLLALIADDEKEAAEIASAAVERFAPLFQNHWFAGLRAKIGLRSPAPDDDDLINDLFRLMQDAGADFTNTFLSLAGDGAPLPLEFQPWIARWHARLDREGVPRDTALSLMRSVNPVVIPRNHRVEEALAAASEGDLTVMHQLLQALADPFDATAANLRFREPGPSDAAPYRTFCGT